MLFIAPHGMRSARRRGQVGGVPPPVLWRVQNETGGGRTPGLPPRLPGADGGQGGPPHLCRCEGEPRTWPSRGAGTPGLRPPHTPAAPLHSGPSPGRAQGGPAGCPHAWGRPGPAPGRRRPAYGQVWNPSAPNSGDTSASGRGPGAAGPMAGRPLRRCV